MHSPVQSNIIAVFFDSLSEKDCAALGDKLPTLSMLRQSSHCFSNAYACSPEAGPARASLFTGMDMAAHGVWTDGVALPSVETVFPEYFSQYGYNTWLVGRRQLAGVSNWTTEHSRPNEYRTIEWAHGPLHRSRQNAYLTWLQGCALEKYDAVFPKDADPDDMMVPQEQRSEMASLPDDLCFNSWVGERVLDLMCEHSTGQPFLGIAGFVVGESMGSAPEDGTCCEAIVERALIQADCALHAIIQRLKKEGLAENTIIVVTAGRGSVSSGVTASAMTESALKVPLMISLPGGEQRQVEDAISTIDVAPTLFELAQVPPPVRLQGTSLMSSKTEALPRGWALSRLRNPNQSWQTAHRAGRFKLVMIHSQRDAATLPVYELYDLHDDPLENKNLATDIAHLDDLEAMMDLMIDARVALEDRTEPRIASF